MFGNLRKDMHISGEANAPPIFEVCQFVAETKTSEEESLLRKINTQEKKQS
jgi:hypothetical protein